MPKDLPTISLQEIMRGGAIMDAKPMRKARKGKMRIQPVEGMGAELLANQPASDPNTNIIEGDVEGGKITMKKVRSAYKKHVRPVVSTLVKAAVPAVKAAAKTAITGALVSKNVSPVMADKIASVVSDQGVNMLVDASNRSGVTRGAGIKIPRFHAMISEGRVPAMLGGALSDAVPVQMLSTNAASFAAARMQLTKERSVPEVKPFRTESLPVQMQSNPQFTNMALIGGGSGMYAGQGLYTGGGLYLSGRSHRVPGRGLF